MIQFGIDILLQQNPVWKNKRIGLVTNHAATTNKLLPSRKALPDKGFNVVKLFSPEHGLDSKGADGTKIANSMDELTQLPVTSLYGDQLQPSAEDLADVDIVLFDIPDIGCRFYTYLWTMSHVLEACGKHKKKMIVLDRPNPLSGNMDLAEGPMLNENHCASFIGRWHIPVRHSCTPGELALYFNDTKNIHADLEVIKCEKWKRNMFQADWAIKFVPTSPAMQSLPAALLYPGTGLFEATNISEGRGTQMPFTVIGAPWMITAAFLAIFNPLQPETITATAFQFKPTDSKYANQVCNGVQLKIIDNHSFNPVFTGLCMIKLIKELHPSKFEWASYPTSVNPSGKNHLDKLLGIAESEALFNCSFQQFISTITKLTKVSNWQKKMKAYLLYS